MVTRRVAVIGVASGYGAGDPACQDGSEVIRALRFLSDLEAVEVILLRQLGVRVYFMHEVRRRGLSEVFAEALCRVAAHTRGYGISIDLDALDPAQGPGVGTPVPGGLLRTDMTDALALARGDVRLRAVEIVEYNPYRDEHFVTARAVHDLCRSLIP